MTDWKRAYKKANGWSDYWYSMYLEQLDMTKVLRLEIEERKRYGGQTLAEYDVCQIRMADDMFIPLDDSQEVAAG